jgi:hypothetical protein
MKRTFARQSGQFRRSVVLPPYAHTLLAVSDAQGSSQGHLWYDPHGSVLSSTLPVTLTQRLLSSQGLDSRLGLVYHGDGRYYDPAIAHTLQPDPLGGVPQLPQTLNRYAVPSGASVAGQVSPGLHPLLATATKGTAKTALTALIANPARGALIGLLTAPRPTGTLLTLIMSRWARYQYFSSGAASPFEWGSVAMTGWGRSFRAYTVRGLVTEIEPGLFLTESGELVETGVLPESAAVLTAEAETRAILSGTSALWLKHGIGMSWAVALNFAVQYWFDLRNPYLTPQQRWARARWAAGFGGIVGYGLSYAAAAAFGGPVGIAVGFTWGLIWFGVLQPRVFEGEGLSPKRNLAPLQ